MAKTSSIERILKRQRLVKKYTRPSAPSSKPSSRARRRRTRNSYAVAQRALTELPRNFVPRPRACNRCSVTGRARAPSSAATAFPA